MTGFKSASVFALVLLFIVGCNKIDTTDIGNGLIPAVDNINTFLTTLHVGTDNKLFTDTSRMLDGEAHAIGVIDNDPEFGKTVATSYVSFTPGTARSYPFVKRDTVIIDSVVLSLNYVSTYGDSNATQQFEVREIDARFVPFEDSLYRIDNPDFSVRDELVGSALVQFNKLNDSAIYRNAKDTLRRINELRIKLDTSWARRFVSYDTTASSAYANDSVFRRYFAGFQIKSVEGQGTGNALAYFNLADNDRTRITFYCRVQNNGRTDTIAPAFSHMRDPQANIIRRTPANNYLANVTNSNPNDELLYIQSTPGSYAEIDLTGLDTVADINRIVHQAELVLEKYPASQDLSFGAPPRMFIDAISPDGDSVFSIRNDFVILNQDPGYDVALLGGTYRNNQYVFNLTRYIQSIITKKLRNYKLRVYAPFYSQFYYLVENTDDVFGRRNVFVNPPVASGRVVLFGGGSTDPRRAKLRIIYSLL